MKYYFLKDKAAIGSSVSPFSPFWKAFQWQADYQEGYQEFATDKVTKQIFSSLIFSVNFALLLTQKHANSWSKDHSE